MGFGSWVHNLGGKISGEAHRVGNKIHHSVHQGAKFVAKHADAVSNIADKVSKVAGVVGKVASAALPFTAEIPILGEIVGAAAAGGKVIERGASAVSKGAKIAGRVANAELAMDRAMKYSG
tara:strand:+ start:539 stop:901 length:363 start_codon:yes stop_codon:yes gene_type:complete